MLLTKTLDFLDFPTVFLFFMVVIFAFLMTLAFARLRQITSGLERTSLIGVWERSFPEPDRCQPIGLLSYTFSYLPDRTFVLCADLSRYRAHSALSGHFIGPLAAARCALVACPDRQGSCELLARYA